MTAPDERAALAPFDANAIRKSAWKHCPSTHCERRQECASPHECSGALRAAYEAGRVADRRPPPPPAPAERERLARWCEERSAYFYRRAHERGDYASVDARQWIKDAEATKAIAAALRAIPASEGEGFVLVPIEPTPAMLDVWWNALPKNYGFPNCTIGGVYRAMLAAAPPPGGRTAPAKPDPSAT